LFQFDLRRNNFLLHSRALLQMLPSHTAECNHSIEALVLFPHILQQHHF
jgi:hypothetical protein